MKRSFLLAACAAFVLSGCSGVNESPGSATDAAASEFPAGTIELVVPYGPGGANDRVARKIAAIAESEGIVDKPIIVTNIEGAATQSGIGRVANSEPDGYTLLVHHNAIVTAALLGQLPEDLHWQKALVPVAQVLSTPLTFAVLADSKWETIEDLFDDVADPSADQVAFGFPGVNAPQTFAFESVIAAMRESGTATENLNRVYLEGGAQVKTALLSGTIDVVPGITLDTVPDTLGGTYRILAIVADERLESLPDVPTLAETEVPSPQKSNGALEMVVWAPYGTPDNVVQRLNEILRAVYETEAWQEFVAENSAVAVFRSGDEVAAVFESYEEAMTAVLPAMKQIGG
jgi:tripartite-type tricarboxylate transporter receptor subunit TctC